MAAGGTWMFVCAGRSAGETALAEPVIRAAAGRREVVVATDRPDHHRLLEGLHPSVVAASEDLAKLVERARPELIVLANSLTCGAFGRALVGTDAKVVSLECSWLPWAKDPRFGWLARLDRVLFVHPEAAWSPGLRRLGGPFDLPRVLEERVEPVGYVWPAEPPVGGSPRDTVLVYPGHVPDSVRPHLPELWEAVERVRVEHPDLRVVTRLPRGWPQPPGSVEELPWLDASQLAALWSRLALVVCHHGMGTITRAVAHGVPVLALGPGEVFHARRRLWWADMELQALARSSPVEVAYGPLPAALFSERLSRLLDEPPRAPGETGPERAVAALSRVVSVQMAAASC